MSASRKVQVEKFRLIGCRAVQFQRMKRFPQWLFNALAVISLILCVSTIILYLGSASATGKQNNLRSFGNSRTYWGVYSFQRQEDLFEWYSFINPRIKGPKATDSHAYAIWIKQFQPWKQYQRLGFRWGSMPAILTDTNGVVWRDGNSWWIAASPVNLMMALAVLPLIAYVRVRRSFRLRGKRMRDDLCTRCGYDLRATPDRCPECGTASIKS